MNAKLSEIYYSPKGYWKGLAIVKKLAAAAKVAEDVAKNGSLNKPFGKYISQHHATYALTVEFHAQTEIKLEIAIVEYVVVFVSEGEE